MAYRKKPQKNHQKNIPLLDLHGKNRNEVSALLDPFIHTHSQKGTKLVHIMTGKGSGAVKSEVVSYLKQAGYDWKYLGSNEGVLVVWM